MVSPTPSVARHTHDFLELAFVLSGEAKHETEGFKAIIRAGDYFIVDYGAAHEYAKISDEPFTVLNVLFRPEFIDKSLVFCRSFTALLKNYLIKINLDENAKNPFGGVFHDSDGEVGRLLSSMLDEYEREQVGYLEILRSRLIELLIVTARKTAAVEPPQTPVSYAARAITENVSSPPTLYEIASRFGYSIPYVSALFKKETGKRYRDYVAEKRVEEACRLLANTDLRIVDVAYECGYSDVNHFFEIFKRLVGSSPAAFRKECRG